MPADLLVPEDVLRMAEDIIRKQKEPWPWDDWFNLGKDFDLNLFRSSGNGATIYAVRNGNTDTSRWRSLNIRRIQEGGAK